MGAKNIQVNAISPGSVSGEHAIMRAEKRSAGERRAANTRQGGGLIACPRRARRGDGGVPGLELG
jgi:hypothetical protein